ncbi:MAG: cysteine desulfurase IscS [Phycisphaerae bacterium SM23_33]|nr:MAG: cysteine desulfurase IscS [Phycisphaerae bacterium SM23_33]
MAVKTPVYLDNNATTPVDPRVLEAMLPYLREHFGNAASRSHSFGWTAEAGVEKARRQVAELIHADPREIIFTSGATESDNLAIKGAAEMHREQGNHIVTCQTEHKAVLDTCEYLARHGFEVTFLKPDSDGLVAPEQVADAVTDRTILITLMTANNEIGTIHPIAEIAAAARRKGALFHTDATQAVGKIPIDVQAMGVDLLSLSAHKIYGPKGIGALYVRRRQPRVRLAIQMHGGGHERGLRSGTLNVPGIVGLGAAAEICGREMPEESRRLTGLRDRLHRGITEALDEVTLNGHPTRRLPNTVNLSFAYVEGESLMMKLSDVAVSSGSACTSASLEPSFVLKALGVGDDLAHGSIRFSLGRFNAAEEIEYAIQKVVAAVRQLRELSPLYEMARQGVDIKTVKWGQE